VIKQWKHEITAAWLAAQGLTCIGHYKRIRAVQADSLRGIKTAYCTRKTRMVLVHGDDTYPERRGSSKWLGASESFNEHGWETGFLASVVLWTDGTIWRGDGTTIPRHPGQRLVFLSASRGRKRGQLGSRHGGGQVVPPPPRATLEEEYSKRETAPQDCLTAGARGGGRNPVVASEQTARVSYRS